MNKEGAGAGGDLEGADVFNGAKFIDCDAAGTLRITASVAMR